jgi:hypothetical protein
MMLAIMCPAMTEEKRRIPRLTLLEPQGARLSDREGTLLDLSNGGALVEHEFPLKAGGALTLEFVHDGLPVRLSCLVVRTRLGRSTVKAGSFAYSSGLRFTDPMELSRQVVRQIVANMSRER